MVEHNTNLKEGVKTMTTEDDQNSERLEIHENALTSDYIERANDGYYFYNGNKYYKWLLVYYTYAHEWGDKRHVFYGNTLDGVLKHYPKERLADTFDDDDEWTTGDLIDNYEWGL